jgi:tRNA A-37 threonylcarbamoyl transferase component Bud32
VERASFGGVECALKLFQLLPANQRAFVKEARRLRQLAHPNVVEVRAVFVDGATGVIEMPLYAHGDLWQWLAAAPRTVHDKLRVLRATLCGLEHVHRMGVVHADVKPENVFVDSDGVAKLGDFDVSKDDATRVTMAATVVGFSLAYAAPEIKNGSTASKAGDMYAFGLTLFDIVHGAKPIKARPINVELLARDEPIEDGTSLRDLTRRLVDESARSASVRRTRSSRRCLRRRRPVAIRSSISASARSAANRAGSTKASSAMRSISCATTTWRAWRRCFLCVAVVAISQSVVARCAATKSRLHVGAVEQRQFGALAVGCTVHGVRRQAARVVGESCAGRTASAARSRTRAAAASLRGEMKRDEEVASPSSDSRRSAVSALPACKTRSLSTIFAAWR